MSATAFRGPFCRHPGAIPGRRDGQGRGKVRNGSVDLLEQFVIKPR
jgi:hypothetical protein